MAETPDEPRTRRAPMWMRVMLGVSLALNLAVIGIVVGAAARFGGPPPRGPAMMSYAMPYVLALPRADRRAVLNRVRQAEVPGGSTRKARRAQYAQMIEMLRLSPFDPDAVRGVLDQQSTAARTVQTLAQEGWLERVTAMSDAERAAYAEEVSKVLRRGPRKANKPSKPPKPEQ